MIACPTPTKIGYATKHEAKAAKRSCIKAAERGVDYREESRIYRCRCGSWHLASTPHREYEEQLP